MAGKGVPSDVAVIGKAEVKEAVAAGFSEEGTASAVVASAGSSEGGIAPAVAAAGGPSDVGKAPAPAVAAAVAAGVGEAKEEAGTKLVEMPESHVRWILAQELRPVFTLDDYSVTTDMYPQEFLDDKRELMSSIRESLLASQAKFAEYQTGIREEYRRHGRVMIPEELNPPIDDAQRELNRMSIQEEIDRLFAQGEEEFERDHPELVALIAEVEAMPEHELLVLASKVDGKSNTEDGNVIAGTVDSNSD